MQSVESLENDLDEQLQYLDQSLEEINDLTIQITEIVAPPFNEEQRGKFIRDYFVDLGYRVNIDKVGNVIASVDDINEPLIVSAHLDTVFDNAKIKVESKGSKLYGPGVGDDSRGLANLLIIAKILKNTSYVENIVFVATVGEEGRGDLRGVKHLFSDQYSWKPKGFITIDGSTTSQVVDQGVGSLRYRLYFRGPGGHSYGSFGTVNPVFSLGYFLSDFQNLEIDKSIKSTFSAGVIGGGTSINAIPEEVWVDLDLRSESPRQLKKMSELVETFALSAVDRENKLREGEIQFELEEVGNRPAGKLNENSLIRNCLSAIHNHMSLGLQYHGSSTDANVPLSKGIPAISVASVEESGRAHTQDEWIDASDASLIPIKRNLLLIALLSVEL